MDTPPAPAPAASESRRRGPVLIASLGALTAVVIGVLVALGVFRSDPSDDTPPPASEGGLQIELAQTDVGPIDPRRPLRCFVEGKLVGELTVAQCAERNGVAAQGLDVGLDDTGALAAVVSAGPPGIPIAPADQIPLGPSAAEPLPPAPVSNEPTGACIRQVGGEQRPLGEALTLETCIQVLFSGRCVNPGDAFYGQWAGRTVRLVQGGTEIADANGYRPLYSQDPRTCLIN
jgi:hypothetical protein